MAPGITSFDEFLDLDNIQTSFWKHSPFPTVYTHPSKPSTGNNGILSPTKASEICPFVLQDHDYVTNWTEQGSRSSVMDNRYNEKPTSINDDDDNNKSSHFASVLDVDDDDDNNVDVTSITSIDFEDCMMMNTDGDDAILFTSSVKDSSYDTTSATTAIHMDVVTGASSAIISAANSNSSKSLNYLDDNEMVADDYDFLHGLDQLDLDLNGFDPSVDMATEDTFEHFMDETLNNPLSQFAEEVDETDNDDDEAEDSHKKEFFLKLLGLKAASSTLPLPQQKSSSTLDIPMINSELNSAATTHESHSFSSSSSTPSSSSFSSSTDCCDNLWCSKYNSCQTSKSNTSTNTSSVVTMTSSTPSDCCITSVPAKMCSRAAVNRMSSPLYSTAPVYSHGRGGQTSLSTANNPINSPSDFIINSMGPISSTTLNHSCHLPYLSTMTPEVANNGSAMTNTVFSSQLHSEGNGADEFLRLLEEDEEDTGPLATSSPLPSIHCDGGHYIRQNDTSSLSPSNVQSLSDLDSFIDLEEFATEVSSPVEREDSIVCHSDPKQLSSGTRFEYTDKFVDSMDNDKYSQYSELRFRLSLLDDYSMGSLHGRESEKCDSSTVNPFCEFGNNGSNGSMGTETGFSQGDFINEFWIEPVLSPLSPYSSSCSPSSPSCSVQSPISAAPSKKVDQKSLELLGLFSDENSPLLC